MSRSSLVVGPVRKGSSVATVGPAGRFAYTERDASASSGVWIGTSVAHDGTREASEPGRCHVRDRGRRADSSFVPPSHPSGASTRPPPFRQDGVRLPSAPLLPLLAVGAVRDRKSVV